MKLPHVFASTLLLTAVSLAQQPSDANNPQDRTAPTDRQTYTRPVETATHNWGGWGLLGLFGLCGLLGRRRDTTATGTYTRDERSYGQQRRAS